MKRHCSLNTTLKKEDYPPNLDEAVVLLNPHFAEHASLQTMMKLMVRCLIHAVVATPATGGPGVALEVRGRLAAMVGVANDNGAPRGAMSVMKTGVAGAGFEPATFRL